MLNFMLSNETDTLYSVKDLDNGKTETERLLILQILHINCSIKITEPQIIVMQSPA